MKLIFVKDGGVSHLLPRLSADTGHTLRFWEGRQGIDSWTGDCNAIVPFTVEILSN